MAKKLLGKHWIEYSFGRTTIVEFLTSTTASPPNLELRGQLWVRGIDDTINSMFLYRIDSYCTRISRVVETLGISEI